MKSLLFFTRIIFLSFTITYSLYIYIYIHIYIYINVHVDLSSLYPFFSIDRSCFFSCKIDNCFVLKVYTSNWFARATSKTALYFFHFSFYNKRKLYLYICMYIHLETRIYVHEFVWRKEFFVCARAGLYILVRMARALNNSRKWRNDVVVK